MKHPLIILTAFLLLAGCGRQGDAQRLQQLQGTWIYTRNNVTGDDFKSTITIDATGNYLCEIESRDQQDHNNRTFSLAGYMKIRGGFLIDTMTKHSNTNAVLPTIFTNRIVRMNDTEIVMRMDTNAGSYMPSTTEIVFRKKNNLLKE